jgi:hypothetical protein
MKTHVAVRVGGRVAGLVVALGVLLGTVRGLGAEGDDLARLDGALKVAAAFEYGKDAKALREAESIVVEAVRDSGRRAAVEGRLLGALSGPGTRDGKEFVCRQLLVVGTARCIPQLEGLLVDAGLAVCAIGFSRSVEGTAMTRALADLAAGVGPDLQELLLNALGGRKDRAGLGTGRTSRGRSSRCFGALPRRKRRRGRCWRDWEVRGERRRQG